MTDLQRLTTVYIDREDRIRLAGTSADGTFVTLWLTRRLLDRLIPHLILWLEGPHADLPRADVVLEFAQQAALSQLAPQVPVAATESQGRLVESVNITPGNDRIHLNFHPESGEPAGIGFAEMPLRQWLDILYRAYIIAEWPQSPWPEWLVRSGMTRGLAAPPVWH